MKKKKNYVLKCLVHIPSPSTTGMTWCWKVAEDVRVRASTNKIGRHHLIFSDSHDAIIFIALRSFPECFCDVIASGDLIKAYDEIDGGRYF